MYFSRLDAYRFIAVIFVMISHWLPFVKKGLLIGEIGVLMFFVLSGFLISNILILKATNPLQNGKKWENVLFFYLKRALRIFPLYYLVVLSMMFVFRDPFIIENSPSFLMYTTNFLVLKNGEWIGKFSHLWSLAIEEQFYLFWPFVILFLSHKRAILITLLILLIISLLFALFVFKEYAIEFFVLPTYISIFSLIAGSLLSWIRIYSPDILKKFSTKTAVLLSFFFLWFIHLFNNFKFFNILFLIASTFFSICFITFLISATVKKSDFFWKKRSIIYFGKISYGIYLFHNFVPFLLFYFFNFQYQLSESRTFLSYIVYYVFYPILFLVVTIILATVSWELFEKRINNLKSHIK